MTEKKNMYYCCYQNCYFYSIKSQQELIHYIEDHGETYEEAEKLANKILNLKVTKLNIFINLPP